eukprot:Nitzschia sp. Nitz4//scaffold49_size126201//118729//120006//NITZ4_003663-RA/size126201-processed-gene-0.103-mRNA-1//-1//CDS//3329553212//3732//frame0
MFPTRRAMAQFTSARGKQILTTLTAARGSEGAGLPTALSDSTIDIVTATAPVVAPLALDITKNFYTRMLGNHPELLAYFNPSHNVPISLHQPKALAGSIVAYATHIKDLGPLLVPGGPVEAIAHRHCALAVVPAQYFVVHENVMAAIAEVLGDAVTPEIGGAWNEAVLFLAKALIDLEENVYQMLEDREGGWSGLLEFEVTDIDEIAKDVKTITFKPPAGSALEGSKFEFTAGQYLSLGIDIDGDGKTAPRHFTVTSPPMSDYLQCSIKKIPGGKVSTYVHENLKVGDTVKLAAPLGVFTAAPSVESAVLVSAGIGVTPMVNLKKALGDKVKLCAHVGHEAASFPFKDDFVGGLEKFTDVQGGRTKPSDLATELLEKAGKDNTFFICGPSDWMNELQSSLLTQGAKNVQCEVFGSQLGTGCPFKA